MSVEHLPGLEKKAVDEGLRSIQSSAEWNEGVKSLQSGSVYYSAKSICLLLG